MSGFGLVAAGQLLLRTSSSPLSLEPWEGWALKSGPGAAQGKLLRAAMNLGLLGNSSGKAEQTGLLMPMRLSFPVAVSLE